VLRLGEDAATIQGQLAAIHRELRRELPGIARVAVAIYDPPTDTLKTFVHSTEGAPPFNHHAEKLSNVPALAALAGSGGDRIISDLAAGANGATSWYRQRLLAAGFRSSYATPFFDHGRLHGFVFFDALHTGYFTPPRMRHVLLCAHLVALLVMDSLRRASVLRSAVAVAKHFGNRRDGETGAHLDRMAHYSRLIAEVLAVDGSFDDEFVEFVFLFAPLHDIGKIAIPDEILLKRGRLSPAEFETMKRHVSEGAGMIETIVDSFGVGSAQHVAVLRNIVRYHHEWFDGSGYLTGLSGDAIPLEARIVSVADVFDALTSERPYKTAQTNAEAAAHLRAHAGRQFDPACVAALLDHPDAIVTIQRKFAARAGFHEAYQEGGL
jgi:hypothetical protein